MKRIAILLIVVAGFTVNVNAQGPATDDIVVSQEPLLNAMQLQREKTFSSLEEALANPEKCYKLCLSNKKLKTIPKEIFYLTNLQELDLSDNKIEIIPAEMGNLKRLQYINLYHNRIKVLPPEMQELGNMHTLYVANNRLTEIPAWVGGMGKLRIFNFTYNRITRLEAERVQAALKKSGAEHGFKN
jgi:Leucine-rich repeat (LRR) protein